MKNFAFPKKEKLTSKKAIEKLFLEGKSIFQHPLKALYIIDIPDETERTAVKVLFIVPKRKFKHAVDRNILRRRLRESYRLSKHPLFNLMNDKQWQMNIAFLYSSDELLSYQSINDSLNRILEIIQKKATSMLSQKNKKVC